MPLTSRAFVTIDSVTRARGNHSTKCAALFQLRQNTTCEQKPSSDGTQQGNQSPTYPPANTHVNVVSFYGGLSRTAVKEREWDEHTNTWH